MKTQRTLPPAATPICFEDIAMGIAAIALGKNETLKFENSLKKHFKVRHCFLVSSGKAAFYCILKALQKTHPDRNEVLVPAYNCYSVPSAIVRAGCKVRLCEVSPGTLDFDAKELSRNMSDSKRLLCIVPTHLFGLHANVKVLKDLVKDGPIAIVEDAAQAMGSRENDTWLGLLGDVGFFSLGRGKAFSTYEGGVIVTNNDDIGNAIKTIVQELPEYSRLQVVRLVLHSIAVRLFSHPNIFWLPKAIPFLKLGDTFFEHDFNICKLSHFQAGLAWNWENKLQRLLEQRRANTGFYASYFNENPCVEILPFVKPSGDIPNLLRFPVRMKDQGLADAILEKSKESGLGIATTFPLSLDELPELKGQTTGEYPLARNCSRTMVTLPVHCHVKKEDLEKITALLTIVTGARQGTTAPSP
jgi:perosamine synthetase